MKTHADGERRSLVADVAVVGGGLAGLATATHLARTGHDVLCLEPRSWPRPAVGESLEFSAAKLLRELGVETAADSGSHLYPKTVVRIVGDADEFEVWPPKWFARAPIWCSRVAFHTDRSALDEKLADIALSSGVCIVPDRVKSITTECDRVVGLSTDLGTQVSARWYVDASGHNARMFGRALQLDLKVLGESRTAYWTRLSEPPSGHATTLHFPDPAADELAWVWEIPLNDNEISVGAVISTARAKRLRANGLEPRDVFEHQVAPIERLSRATEAHPHLALQSTSYSPFVHRRTVGPNWVLVGDSAAMVDPLTSNGVTSALRHAEGAARLVSRSITDERPRHRLAWAYQKTAPANIATLDQAIESFLYEPRIRHRLGLRWAVSLYAATGVITNSLYAKIETRSLVRAAGCAAMLGLSRTWTRTARTVLAARTVLHRPATRPRPSAAAHPHRKHGDAARTAHSTLTGAAFGTTVREGS